MFNHIHLNNIPDNFSVNTPSSRDKLQAAIHELRLFGAASPPDNKHCSTPGSTDKENTQGRSMHGRTNPLPGKARQRPQFQAVPQADNGKELVLFCFVFFS